MNHFDVFDGDTDTKAKSAAAHASAQIKDVFLVTFRDFTEFMRLNGNWGNEAGSESQNKEFYKLFALGPGGADYVIARAQRILTFTVATKELLSKQSVNRRLDVFLFCGYVLEAVKHIRLAVPREKWDLAPMSRLTMALNKNPDLLPVRHLLMAQTEPFTLASS